MMFARLLPFVPIPRMLALLTVLLVAACSESPPRRSAVYLSPFGGGPEIQGTRSSLVRHSSGISMTVQTTGLTPGDRYTAWWLVFNVPGECTGPCGVDDLGLDTASVLFADGSVIGTSGIGQFGGYLGVGDTNGLVGTFGSHGLTDPLGADVHIAVRSHGQPIPGVVNEQLSAFFGGCPPNACSNEQRAVHPASVSSVPSRRQAFRRRLGLRDPELEKVLSRTGAPVSRAAKTKIRAALRRGSAGNFMPIGCSSGASATSSTRGRGSTGPPLLIAPVQRGQVHVIRELNTLESIRDRHRCS